MLAVVFSFNAGFFRFNMVIFLCTFVLAALAAVIIFVGAAAEGTLAIRLVWFFCRIWLDCFVDLAITAIPTTFSRILISSITIESQAIAAVPTTRCLVGLSSTQQQSWAETSASTQEEGRAFTITNGAVA